MEQTKGMVSHLSLIDLSDPKDIGVQHHDQDQGQVLDIGAYHCDYVLDDDFRLGILCATSDDDRPKFVALMKSLYERPLPEGVVMSESDVTEVKICPPYVLFSVVSNNAVVMTRILITMLVY